LDVKTNTTGEFSLFTKFEQVDIMFHVSTMLPFTPKDEHNVERKRHLGNDVAIIIFKEGSTAFNPGIIKSQFNHIFVVISPVKENNETLYHVECCSQRKVPIFGPSMPLRYLKKEELKNFVLTKIFNGERAAMHASAFQSKIERTREEILSDLVATDFAKLNRADSGRKIMASNTLVHLGYEIHKVKSDELNSLFDKLKDPISLKVNATGMIIKTTVEGSITVKELEQKLKVKVEISSDQNFKLICGSTILKPDLILRDIKPLLESNKFELTFAED